MPTRRGGSKKKRMSKRMKIRKRRGGNPSTPATAGATESGAAVINKQVPEPEQAAAGGAAVINKQVSPERFPMLGGYYSKKRRKRARKSKRKNY